MDNTSPRQKQLKRAFSDAYKVIAALFAVIGAGAVIHSGTGFITNNAASLLEMLALALLFRFGIDSWEILVTNNQPADWYSHVAEGAIYSLMLATAMHLQF